MILAGQWEPSPPRPHSLDDCNDRGFDTDSAKWDRVTPEPLNEVWQAALDGAIAEAKHLRECDTPSCGDIRCQDCDERMTCTGPEPRACGVTCEDCPCDCTACLRVREDMRDELLGLLEREARDE
jgi:hypothetical protein